MHVFRSAGFNQKSLEILLRPTWQAPFGCSAGKQVTPFGKAILPNSNSQSAVIPPSVVLPASRSGQPRVLIEETLRKPTHNKSGSNSKNRPDH